MELKKKIIEYIASLGISEVGVVKCSDEESAIVCLFPYFSGYSEEANLSVYTYSEDYHKIVSSYLTKICEYIKTLIPDVTTSIYVDNHDGDDRRMAYAAGLGVYGRNGLIINRKYGSYVFVGYITLNVSLPPDGPYMGECMMCGKCVSACPGGALSGEFEAEKCASHISQTKGELEEEKINILRRSGLVFGCDICQRVCPMNERAEHTCLPDFLENKKCTLTIQDILGMSEREFKKKYGNRAFSWRGRKILERNLSLIDGIKNGCRGKI